MANFVCDFGNRHPCDKHCDCPKKYRCTPSEFRTVLFAEYGTWVEEPFRYKTRKVLDKFPYPCDITPEMRNEVLKLLNGT